MYRIISLLLAAVLTMAAHGKIEYTPFPSRAASLAGTLYLLLLESDNLIGVNPGFETGDLTGYIAGLPILGWNNNVTVVGASPYDGSYNAKLEDDAAFYMNPAVQTMSFTRNTRYKIGFAHKANNLSGDPIIFQIVDENNLTVYLDNAIIPTNSWTQYWGSFTTSTDYTGCYFLCAYNSSGTNSVEVDRFIIAPEYLDMGLDSFSIDILHQPLTQTTTRVLAQKLLTASPYNGYQLYYDWADYKYKFFISDGVNSTTLLSAAVTPIQNQEWHWVRATIDRTTDKVKFYVNGVQSGSDGDIAAVTGNISTTGELRLFGYDSTNQRYKGFCGFVRFQRGTLRSDAWMAEEWARIQAGRIRKSSSATAMWEFDDNLVDECQSLMVQENTGTLTYADGWPYCVSPISYTFSVNYRHERRLAPLGGDSLIRSYRTGAAYLIPAPRKDSWELPFVGITQAQYSAFLAAYEGGEPIDFWLDADNEKTGQFYISPDSPPEMEGIPYFRNGELVVNTTLYLVET